MTGEAERPPADEVDGEIGGGAPHFSHLGAIVDRPGDEEASGEHGHEDTGEQESALG
jgi:hypothetical protein